ncbi:MAG: peptidylprolyl isomerase [Deferribacteres bacterium]|nr:peptidylprolyl isomerase [candidate division KSB1 bacterium]MCB9502922.1 peptidylprolyl isomerase [Deferribacteres bacterium]
MTIKRNSFFFLLSLTLVMFLFFGCSEEKQKSPIIVRIGTETLTIDDLQKSMPEDIKSTMTRDDIREYVRNWMNNQILYQEGLRKGFGEDPFLQKRVEDYRKTLIGSAYIDDHLKGVIAFADSAIQNYYEENVEDFTRQNDEIYLYHILLPTKKQADSVYNLIRWRKHPFDTTAQQIAEIQGLEKSEWDLGYISKGMLLNELYQAVENRSVGLPTRPLETDFGFHILQVQDRKNKGTIRELEEVREEIISRLQHIYRNERYRQHLSLLKNGASIETNFQLIDSMPIDSLLYTSKPSTQSE